MIGLSNAVELVTSGNPVDAEEVARLGLADDLVDAEDLLAAAIRLVRADCESGLHLKDRQRWAGPIDISENELGFLGATASAYIQQQTKGQYPAPLAALEVMLGAASADLETACRQEAEGFPQDLGSNPPSRVHRA